MIARGLLRGNAGRLACLRALHRSCALSKAQIFAMPAMSPTMEKGGIVEWKFKVGEPFSAGDVLLEVETDKSQIDVEAQDDGKLAKIVVDNGAKDINVGEVIAYLAEPEDDLATLELPQAENASGKPQAETNSAPKSSATAETSSASSKQESKPEPKKAVSSGKSSDSKSSTSVPAKANPSQTLLPSVQVLLHINNISVEDALNNISASGPNGRILKGDVLSYLGKVSQESVTKLAEYIEKGSALDLTNIELKKPEPASDVKEEIVKKEPIVLSNQLHLKVESGVTYEQLARSLESYIKEAKYLSHEQPISNPYSEHFDAVFEELITPEPRAPRFEVSYDLIPLSGSDISAKQQDDIFDLLAGTNPSPAKREADTAQPNEFLVSLRVQVSDKFTDSQIKAERFVEYLKDLETSAEL
ncbi:LAQU0S17e01090g1_1 [Lachancea quebecensis]|uniref:Dihydrolipoamide dehydrogenase-binding protein of pyruvate dehydrogenase complex n=1 Tax=Lachancea quebecensis TaxID=1654605 RepID=A0A0P1KWL6_9SACH|nr:LAQU0S17e01090g1_1 [Lachancea quebecensis]